MSKREEGSNTRVSPRALQQKLNVISKQRSVNEGRVDSKKTGDSLEELSHGKMSHTDKSILIDDPNFYEKHLEMIRQLRSFYEELKIYSMMSEDIRDKLTGVISEEADEDPLQVLKCMNYIVGLLIMSTQKENYKSTASRSEHNCGHEELLQKAENDIRQHIRIEQQMKLLIDSLQARVEELEKGESSSSDNNDKSLSKEPKFDPSKLLEELQKKDEEMANLQKTLKQKEESIKALEEKAVKITILEHTLKNEKETHKKDKENVRNYYDQELANLTKEIHHIQRVLSINMPDEEKVKLFQEELTSSRDYNIKKVQLLENRLRQVSDVPHISERENTEPTAMHTDPGFEMGRYSVRPSATTSSIMKSRTYDLRSHRCSTELFPKNSENRQPSRQTPLPKRKDIVSELKSTSVVGTKFIKSGIKGEQPQQGPIKTYKDTENYFDYLKRRFDNLPPASDKEKDHLKSFDGRRSSSVKRGVYLNGSTVLPKDRSSDRLYKGDISRTQEERSDSLGATDKHTKSVPKLLRTATNTIYAKILKR